MEDEEKRIAAIERKVQKQLSTIKIMSITLVIVCIINILIGIKMKTIINLLGDIILLIQNLSDLVL